MRIAATYHASPFLALALDNPARGGVLGAPDTATRPGVAGPQGSLPLPQPNSSAAPYLRSALETMGASLNEALLLRLEKDSNSALGNLARELLKNANLKAQSQHQQQLDALKKAIDAAGHKSWWQKLLTFFKVVAIAASAASGWMGAIAAALLVAAWALESKCPKASLALQIAASALMVANAAGSIAANVVDKGASCASYAANALESGAFEKGSTVLSRGLGGAGYVAAGATAGEGIATGVIGHYEGVGLRADAQRLGAKQMIEEAEKLEREEVELLKTLIDRDAQASIAFSAIIDRRHDTAMTAVRV